MTVIRQDLWSKLRSSVCQFRHAELPTLFVKISTISRLNVLMLGNQTESKDVRLLCEYHLYNWTHRFHHVYDWTQRFRRLVLYIWFTAVHRWHYTLFYKKPLYKKPNLRFKKSLIIIYHYYASCKFFRNFLGKFHAFLTFLRNFDLFLFKISYFY